MAARKKKGEAVTPDVVSIPNRLTFEVSINADQTKFTTEYEGKTYTGRSALALDQALDKANVPRPRLFKPVLS